VTHAEALTRVDVTPAVHYVRFSLTPGQVDALATGPAALVARHREYRAETPLGEATRAELVGDLRGSAALEPLA
jgi:hypothetical protein